MIYNQQTSNAIEVMSDVQGFFKQGERELIYNACKNDRDRLLIRLLWKSGRRITEILMLKVKEVDYENKGIFWHIEKKTKLETNEEGVKKRNKFDLVKWKPIDITTLEMINNYVKSEGLQSEAYLFQSAYKENCAMTRQRAFQIVRKCCLDSGIELVGNKKPHPHHFRHSFAVEMAQKIKTPADIRKLQMLMEHANLGITEQYLQFNAEDLRELIED